MITQKRSTLVRAGLASLAAAALSGSALANQHPHPHKGSLEYLDRNSYAKNMRVLLYWESVVRSKNSKRKPASLAERDPNSAGYDFSRYDAIISEASARGINVMLTLTQDGGKRVSGTLTGHGNSSLQVQARAESEGLRGTAANSFGMLYLTGRLDGDELSIVLTESDLGGKPNPQRARELRLAKLPAKVAVQDGALSQALTRNAWCSFAYDIGGNRAKERLAFNPNGLVSQTPGKPPALEASMA